MIMKTVALVKGVDERTSVKDGKIYRSVMLYGLEGRPCDISASVNDDTFFNLAKKNQFQRMAIALDCRVYNGMTFFDVVAMEGLPIANK